MNTISFEHGAEQNLTPKGRIEFTIDPEAISPETMKQLAFEIAALPEFAIQYKGELACVSVGMLEAAVEGGDTDTEGFKIDGFTSSLSTSGKPPKIWVPALTPRPWRVAELPESKDPSSKTKPVPKDFTSSLLQRYFNLVEGEGLRERGLTPAPADENGKKPKQLTTTTIWRMMDPRISEDDRVTYVEKVRSAYKKLFDSSTTPNEITAMTDRFVAMVEKLRTIQPV